LYLENFFINFDSNGLYYVNNILIGTQNVNDLEDISPETGICAHTPGWIIIELNDICTFEKIGISGFAGNEKQWAPNNGSGAKISTSIDKIKWTEVGNIPGNYGKNIININLVKTSAKYIKFQSSFYLGIGFLKIFT